MDILTTAKTNDLETISIGGFLLIGTTESTSFVAAQNAKYEALKIKAFELASHITRYAEELKASFIDSDNQWSDDKAEADYNQQTHLASDIRELCK